MSSSMLGETDDFKLFRLLCLTTVTVAAMRFESSFRLKAETACFWFKVLNSFVAQIKLFLSK